MTNTTTEQSFSSTGNPEATRALACPWCGQLHARIPLKPDEIGKCVRCDAVLASGRTSHWSVTLAWVLTALILWVPANVLPIVSLAQFGVADESRLATSVTGLWEEGMPWVAVLVASCGIIAPLLLLCALTALLVPLAFKRAFAWSRFLVRWLRALELWSIPEVYLLGVLVAFIKLGDVVRAAPGAGLWCHAGMAIALFLAWRHLDIDAVAETLARQPAGEEMP